MASGTLYAAHGLPLEFAPYWSPDTACRIPFAINISSISFNIFNFLLNLSNLTGGLAQLARACDWQSQGQGFDSPNLHVNEAVMITKK